MDRNRTEADMTSALMDALLDPVGAIRWWLHRDRHHLPPTPCADCNVECLPNTPPHVRDWHRYMVHDHVWTAAGMGRPGGWVCLGCIEDRLGRPLTADDLADLPLNDLDGTKDVARLARLKLAAGHGKRPR
jgi:hypothetical protein